MKAHIFQISISPGGVPKSPIHAGRVEELGIVGDAQKHLQFHGGPTRALCLFALETLLELQREGHPIFPGAVGENITTVGLDFATLKFGDRLQLGPEVVIELTSYAAPCATIRESFAEGAFKRISAKVHPGASRLYARIITPGTITTGDSIALLKAVESAQGAS